MDFKNKVAVVTGASVGIGYGCAVKFSEGGADLVLIDVNYEKLLELMMNSKSMATTCLFTNAVLPRMKECSYGRIINACSVAGVYGNANMACYSATKALAKEVAHLGITANCVSLGSVSPAENPDPNFTQKSELAFMGRTGSDMENANAICFLASDEASYISCQNIQVDGCHRKQ